MSCRLKHIKGDSAQVWTIRTYDVLEKVPGTSVTRLGDFMDIGQVFKAFGNNYLICPNLPHS